MIAPMNTPVPEQVDEVDAQQKEHLTLWVDSRLASELRRVAKQNDRTLSAEVRQAIRDYLRER